MREREDIKEHSLHWNPGTEDQLLLRLLLEVALDIRELLTPNAAGCVCRQDDCPFCNPTETTQVYGLNDSECPSRCAILHKIQAIIKGEI